MFIVSFLREEGVKREKKKINFAWNLKPDFFDWEQNYHEALIAYYIDYKFHYLNWKKKSDSERERERERKHKKKVKRDKKERKRNKEWRKKAKNERIKQAM